MTRPIVEDLLKASKQAIKETSSYKKYRISGSESIELFEGYIDLCNYILELEKKLEEKPKTITKIKYRGKHD